MSYLSLRGLTKQYPGTDKPSVDSMDLDIEQGEFVSLLGPSGCGKTTTLRMIAGLIDATSGSIELAGDDLTAAPVHKRDMGMVFQAYALFPHMDVGDNVAFGLRMRKVSKSERKARVAQALDLVQLGHLSGRRVRQLSGGQQQRVALARALVIEPKVLLLDEPLSNLDAQLRETMRDEIRSIQRKIGITTVFVTHDQDEALATSDRIVVMSDGLVEQVGTPREVYEEPETRFVGGFIGRANFFPGTVRPGETGESAADIPGIGTRSARDRGEGIREASVMVRPHRITLSPSTDGESHGQIARAVYVGDTIEYTVDVDGQQIQVHRPALGEPDLDAGTPVRLDWQARDALVLE